MILVAGSLVCNAVADGRIVTALSFRLSTTTITLATTITPPKTAITTANWFRWRGVRR